MFKFSETLLFTIRTEQFCGKDVVLAAKFWGDWSELEQEVREQLSCVKKMEETQDFPADEELEFAANEFRYARELLTVEETEKWFRDHGVSPEMWAEHIERALLVRKWSRDLPEILSRFPIELSETYDIIELEAVCSGKFQRLSHHLAGRAALYEKRMQPGFSVLADAHPDEFSALMERLPFESASIGLPLLDRDDWEKKLERFARYELCFQQYRKHFITPEIIQNQIRLHALDWIHLNIHSVSFPAIEMAREAALCVREDGAPLVEIARDAKQPFIENRVYLDQLEPELKNHFLGAQKSDLIGPLNLNDKFVLHFVQDKKIPSIEDIAICKLAEENYLNGILEQEINNSVTWHLRF